MSDRCSANRKRAIRNRLADCLILPRGLKEGRGGDRRNGFPERHLIRINHAQNFAAEILHGSGSGSDIERIARRDQNDDEIQSNKSGCSRVILAKRG